PDGELEAIRQVLDVLSALETPVQERVWSYVGGRLGLAISRPISTLSPNDSTEYSERTGFGTVADLFERAMPEGEMAKALTVAYWLQTVQGAADWESFAVNSELKHLGHGVSNITKVLDRLTDKKPQLVIQVR